MTDDPSGKPIPSQDQLLAIIRIQTEIAKLGLDLGGVMALVVEKVLTLVRADGAVIELAEGSEMVYRAATGIASPQLGLRLNRKGSLSGLCVESGHPLLCSDSDSDPRVDQAACRRIGLRSMLVVPLKHGEAVVGVLKVMSLRADAFAEGDAAVLELMSELLAAAMFHAARYASDDLFHRATHDDLTGLANRALFLDRLRNGLARAERDRRAVGVLISDMDDLKRINDDLGHRAGDAALREFARRLQATARKSDTVARLGGDEFGILLTPVNDRDDLRQTCKRIAAAVQQPFAYEGRAMDLRASLGTALYPDDSRDIETILDLADRAMYVDKRQRKAAPPH